jgi:hypothetical protein
MKVEKCPFRTAAYKHVDIGASKPEKFYQCTAVSEGKNPIRLGNTEAEAIEQACRHCPIPNDLDKAPKDAVPQATWTQGKASPALVNWKCSVCGTTEMNDYSTLHSCH